MAFSRYALLLVPALVATAPLGAQAPSSDQARAIDAETRIALFDLLAERPLAALSRLRALQTSTALPTAGASAGYGATEIQFLLAESYIRLGMSDAFRGAARGLLDNGDTRFSPILRLQLLVDAYRRGAYEEAAALASQASATEGGLAPLIGGLANYHLANYPAAQQAFAAVGAGGPYGGYARYMGALAQMAGDTAQTQAALFSLQTLARDALGDFADQVNLTIAQLAYQSGDYDLASTASARVADTSGLAAQAMLTRSWSLYKASQLEPAAQAFAAFASAYPQLPQRDEARLMVGQVMLQQGQIDQAGAYFQRIADSLTVEAQQLASERSSSMADAARALVQARAASMLFLQAPAAGKALALPDNLGMDQSTIARALGSPVPLTPPEQLRPEIVALDDVSPRLDSVAAAVGPGYPRRVTYVFGDAGPTRAEFVRRAQALREADVAVAIARHRLTEQIAAHNAKLALIARLQGVLGEAGARLDTTSLELGAARDSFARIALAADAERGRLRELLQREAQAVQAEAAENVRHSDSIRTTFGGTVPPEQARLMDIERETALTYQRLGENVLAGLDRAFARHPVTLLRDSVQARINTSESLVAQTRVTIGATNDILTNELARLRATEAERTAGGRAAVASAEAARAAAEGAVLVAVEAELLARAEQLLAVVRRDVEAAEFGAASASFFKAVGTTPAATTPGQGSGGAAAGEPGPPSPE